MRALLRSPLRRKVALAILLTSAVSLALASGAHLAYEYSSMRTRLAARLDALAGVVGENCAAPLAFGDRRAAERSLAALVADYRIAGAAVYAADGTLFARFVRGGAGVEFPRRLPAAGQSLSPRLMTVARPVTSAGRPVGSILVLGDLSNLVEQMREFEAAGAAVVVIALLVAALLAYRLQRVIADPVVRLVSATRDVAESGDYAVRVPAGRGDELGQLAGSFNVMLERIARRDSALRESESRYALAVQGSRDGIWDWDLVTGAVYLSPRWLEILGYREGELAQRRETWLERLHPDDAREVTAAFDAHLAGDTPAFDAEFRMRHRSGAWIWVSARGVAVREETGRPVRVAGSLADVTARKGRDALTGLPNRILLVDRLEVALQRAQRQGFQLAVLAVELGRLDLINESYGREAGRELLQLAGDRLLRALGPHDRLARLEGGVFAILVEEVAEAGAAERLAETIHRVLAPAFRVAGQEVFSTTAVGIVLARAGDRTAEDVLRDALTALSRARMRPGSRTEVFEEAMRASALARLDLEKELRRSVERGELELRFQPIVALAGERLAGFEALVRWPRPDGTVALPADFIGLAEEADLIVPLGSWVLREACRRLRDWRAESGAGDDLTVSVNVSARQLVRSDLLAEVESALRAAALPASALKLEITESILIEHLGPAKGVLDALHELGVGLWLDDFGTGYSNLAYLHQYPIEAMKIDRSFVGRLESGARRREIAETLIELARNLGMKTVAEGVETPRQMQRLKTFRCDLIQGHAISLPLEVDAVSAMLRAVAN